MLAERRADAAPLPWMAAAQQGGITGNALLCAAFEPAPLAGQAAAFPLWYRQLPVGGG